METFTLAFSPSPQANAAQATKAAQLLKQHMKGQACVVSVVETKENTNAMSIVDGIRVVLEHPEALSIIATALAYVIGRGSGRTHVRIMRDKDGTQTVIADNVTSADAVQICRSAAVHSPATDATQDEEE